MHVLCGSARDANLQSYAALIPSAILPMFLGGAMKWFPSHMAAFNSFYIVGGVISVVAWLMLGFFVHPPNELPGRSWQCTRHWCYGVDDPWYEKGGPREGEVNPRIEEAAKFQSTAGCAAQMCDRVAFGETIYEVGDASERRPLLGGDVEADIPFEEAVQRKQSDPTIGFSNLQ